MHGHTTNSDGVLSPDSLIKVYKSKGYSFLSITDHNFLTSVTQSSTSDFLLINGEEITFSKHVNGIGISAVINPESSDLKQIVDAIAAQQAIAIINHPLKTTTLCFYNEIYPIENLNFIEIFNARYEAVGTHDNHKLWDSLLTKSKIMYGVANDDAHSLSDIGHAWIEVKSSSLSKDSIFAALKTGDFYCSTGIILSEIRADMKNIFVSSINGDTVKFIGKNGEILKIAEANSANYELNGDELYVRSEVINKLNQKAWIQPVFFKTNTSIQGDANSVPEFQIDQNFPNPFNPVTSIKYSIKNSSRVKLKVFDMLGRVIKTLVNEFQSAGSKVAFWNGTNDQGSGVPSGCYIYRIEAGNFIKSQKMILLK